MGKRTSWRCQ